MPKKYSTNAQKEVGKEISLFKKGAARSGPKLKKVKTRQQAIAIGLAKAGKKGYKTTKKPR